MEVWVLTSSSQFSRWENNAVGIADRRIWIALPYTSLAGGTRTFQQIFRQISLAWFLTISDANRTLHSQMLSVWFMHFNRFVSNTKSMLTTRGHLAFKQVQWFFLHLYWSLYSIYAGTSIAYFTQECAMLGNFLCIFFSKCYDIWLSEFIDVNLKSISVTVKLKMWRCFLLLVSLKYGQRFS